MSNASKITLVITFLLVAIAFVLFLGERRQMQTTEETINAAIAVNQNPTVKKGSSGYGKYNYRSPFINGFAFVELNGKQGVINKNGKEITPIIYDGVWYCSEEMMVVEKNKKFGYIDTSGKEIIPLEFDFAIDFEDGLASVKKNNKWGYINKKGEIVIPLEYDMAWTFSDHLGCVKKDDKWGFINKKGKMVIPFVCDYVVKKFVEGKAEVELEGETVFIDIKGKIIEN